MPPGTLIFIDKPLNGIYATERSRKEGEDVYVLQSALFIRRPGSNQILRYPFTGALEARDKSKAYTLYFSYGLLERITEDDKVIFESEFLGKLPDVLQLLSQLDGFAGLVNIPDYIDPDSMTGHQNHQRTDRVKVFTQGEVEKIALRLAEGMMGFAKDKAEEIARKILAEQPPQALRPKKPKTNKPTNPLIQ